jgi:hypothetical protein
VKPPRHPRLDHTGFVRILLVRDMTCAYAQAKALAALSEVEPR